MNKELYNEFMNILANLDEKLETLNELNRNKEGLLARLNEDSDMRKFVSKQMVKINSEIKNISSDIKQLKIRAKNLESLIVN